MTDTPETLLARAVDHRAAGRWAEAASAYAALLTVMPDLPDTWFNLGLMQRRAGQPHQALAAYQQAMMASGDARPITTRILPLAPFYYAEDYHQQYLEKNPEGYCGLGGIGVCLPPSLNR